MPRPGWGFTRAHRQPAQGAGVRALAAALCLPHRRALAASCSSVSASSRPSSAPSDGTPFANVLFIARARDIGRAQELTRSSADRFESLSGLDPRPDPDDLANEAPVSVRFAAEPQRARHPAAVVAEAHRLIPRRPVAASEQNRRSDHSTVTCPSVWAAIVPTGDRGPLEVPHGGHAVDAATRPSRRGRGQCSSRSAPGAPAP